MNDDRIVVREEWLAAAFTHAMNRGNAHPEAHEAAHHHGVQHLLQAEALEAMAAHARALVADDVPVDEAWLRALAEHLRHVEENRHPEAAHYARILGDDEHRKGLTEGAARALESFAEMVRKGGDLVLPRIMRTLGL